MVVVLPSTPGRRNTNRKDAGTTRPVVGCAGAAVSSSHRSGSHGQWLSLTTPTHGRRGPRAARQADTTPETVVRGRDSKTPFVLLGGVALVIWAIVALVAAALLLIWWLG